MEGLLYPSMDTNERTKDVELVGRIKKGDQKSISALYETHRTEFVRWTVKIAKCSEDEALEFYQAAVLIVYDNAKNGKLDHLSSSLKTYLFAVGKNLAWQDLRQKDREKKLKAEYFLVRHMEDNRSTEMLLEERNMEVITQCLTQLGDPCRELLELYYYHKKSMEEITLQLNYKNADTAKNQKYKCMERLRKMVETELDKKTMA